MMARATASICFCPPDSLPAGCSQNFFSAGKKPKIHSRRTVSSWLAFLAWRAGQQDVLLHGQVGEDAHVLRHVGHAHARHVGRRGARAGAANGRAVEADLALRRAPQSHDRAQRGGLAGAVAAQQHGHGCRRHGQIDAVQDVVRADVRVHVLQFQQRLRHAAFSVGLTPR
jgi:hypothetical protein